MTDQVANQLIKEIQRLTDNLDTRNERHPFWMMIKELKEMNKYLDRISRDFKTQR